MLLIVASTCYTRGKLICDALSIKGNIKVNRVSKCAIVPLRKLWVGTVNNIDDPGG